jgi:hypothetical protein
MSRCTLRNIFTVLIYFGVAMFLYPYVTGRLSSGMLLLVGGLGLAVVCGILRCVCMEGDCTDREYTTKKPDEIKAQRSKVPHSHA